MERTKRDAARDQEPMIGTEPDAEAAGTPPAESNLLGKLITEYAVTSESGLNLRDAPSIEGAVLAVLPQGAGAYSYGEPVDGWIHVRTGRLEGWMMTQYLEALPLPELTAYGAD